MCCRSMTFHLMRSLPDALRRRSLGSRSVQPWRLGSSTHLGQKSYLNAFQRRLQRRFKNGNRIFQKSSLTLIELEIAELAKKALHHAVDVLLESVHLGCSVVVLQILHNLLHVVLEVGHVVVLLGKTSLNQPEIAQMSRGILQGAFHLWLRTKSTPDSEASSVPSSISSAEALLPSSCTSPSVLTSCWGKVGSNFWH